MRGQEFFSAEHGFLGKQARICADPSIQTRNLPRTTVLSAKQLLRAFGNSKGSPIGAASPSVSLSRTFSHCMGGRGGSNKVANTASGKHNSCRVKTVCPVLHSSSYHKQACIPVVTITTGILLQPLHKHKITRMCILFPTKN